MNQYIIEAENKLLGTFAENPDLFSNIEHLVFEEIFTRPHSRAIYKSIVKYHNNNLKPDTALLFSSLKEMGLSQADCANVVDINYDFKCLNNPKPYVDYLFKNWVSQKMMPIIYEAYGKFNSGAGDHLETLQLIKDAIIQVDLILNNAKTDKSVIEIFNEMYARIVDLKEGKIDNIGYSFGLTELDRKTGGLVKGITVIGAQPGQGKTSMVINILKANSVDHKIPTLFFSIEMPAVEIMTNLTANIAEINSKALRLGSVDEGNLMSIKSVGSSLNDSLTIDENGGVTWQYIEAKIKHKRKKDKIKGTMIVLIDYLQLMSNSSDEMKGMNDEQRISKICKELTRIAKTEDCAIVLLSQLAKEVGKRENPRPKMNDLKGSGAIEACAILILLLFRPEYHMIYTDGDGNDLRGLCEINLAKARYANPEPVYVKFLGRYSRFEDYQKPTGIITNNTTPSF